jgi:phenylpropionate dioxygenase-like ring-hydroxylating dioxygenase large terminal subunit
MDPDRWYAVEYDRAVKKGAIKEVVFWNRSIALFRGQDGRLAAVQNHCPHRQLKLTHGVVENCQLRCAYHGWTFNREGWLVDYSHDNFGKPLIKSQLRTYPVQVRYGLIWLFPGEAGRASDAKIPEIPELEGSDTWAGFTTDFTWRTHHSMVLDNICDFAHAFLHRKYRPFTDAKLRHHEADENRVFLTYDTYMAGGRFSGVFVDRSRVNTRSIELCYEYPYQWSNTGNSIKHWCFLLPIGERRTRVFFLFYFDALTVPLTAITMPKWLTQLVLNLAKPLIFRPILAQDGVALEAEQEGYDRHFDAPPIELNPVVPLFQQLTVRKWEDYLARAGAPAA